MHSSTHETLTPRGRLVYRLQWASLWLSWTVFIVSIATRLGATSLYITMSASILTWALEGPLLWRGRRKSPSSADTESAMGPRHHVPALAEARTRSEAVRMSMHAAPSTLSLAAHLPFLCFRIFLLIAWMGGVGMAGFLLYIQGLRILVNGIIIDLLFSVAEIGVMGTVTVLCFMERRRAARSETGDVAKEGEWYARNRQYHQ